MKLGTLRTLIREGYYDTLLANTQHVPASSRAIKHADHQALKSRSPTDTKTDQVVKLIRTFGTNVKVDHSDVKRFISTIEPTEVLVLTARDIAKMYLRNKTN
jgi:hypothetical protein